MSSYNIEAILSARDQGFSSTMNKSASIIDKLTGATESSSGILNKVFGSAGDFAKAKIVLGGVNKVVGAFTDSLGGAVRRVDTMNKFPIMMESWGYSAQESQAAIDELNEGIQGLPTTLDSVVGTTQKLALMTGDLGRSTKLTLALNNAFLASGSSSADASRGLEQFSQMLATGAVDLQSYKTLQETMPVGLQKTAEAFGYAGASAQNDLFQALKKGEITFDEWN